MNHMVKFYLALILLIGLISGGVGYVAYGVGYGNGYRQAVDDLFDVVAENNRACTRISRTCQKALDRCYEIEHPDSNYNNDNYNYNYNENSCIE